MKENCNYGCHDMLSSLHKETPIMNRAIGAVMWDNDGKKYLDLNEMCIVLGQNNKEYIAEIEKTLRNMTSLKNWNHSKKNKLYDYLANTTNGDFECVHFTTSGSEAVEWAVRLAKKISGKSEIMSFWNSIHGRTFLSSSLSGFPKRKASYGVLAPGIISVPYPQCSNCENKNVCSSGNYKCFEIIKDLYKYASAQDIAAIIMEPYLGLNIAIPPKGYIKYIYDWAKNNDMLFIMDEIQSGMGRTGDYYCYQKEGIKPDMLLLGKALGNGMHISALLVKKQPPDVCLPAISGGVGDEVVACSAACEVFRQLENGLLNHINECGELIKKDLSSICNNVNINDIRGAGLSWAIEFVNIDKCSSVYNYLCEKGFMLGKIDNYIYIKPPYVIEIEEIQWFIDELKNAINNIS